MSSSGSAGPARLDRSAVPARAAVRLRGLDRDRAPGADAVPASTRWALNRQDLPTFGPQVLEVRLQPIGPDVRHGVYPANHSDGVRRPWSRSCPPAPSVPKGVPRPEYRFAWKAIVFGVRDGCARWPSSTSTPRPQTAERITRGGACEASYGERRQDQGLTRALHGRDAQGIRSGFIPRGPHACDDRKAPRGL